MAATNRIERKDPGDMIMQDMSVSPQLQLYGVPLTLAMERTSFENLLTYVPSSIQNKVNRYIHYEDAQRCLLANLLTRVVMCSQNNYTNSQLSELMDRDSYGKPYMRGEPVHFNVSHSGCWIALAVDGLPTGIDIEQIKSAELRIAKRFFSPNEYQDLLSKPSDDRMDYFYSLWTLKESYIKADGKGLSIPLNSFSFRIRQEEISFQSSMDSTPYYFKQYSVDEGYKLAVCARHATFPERFTIWNEAELIERAIKTLRA